MHILRYSPNPGMQVRQWKMAALTKRNMLIAIGMACLLQSCQSFQSSLGRPSSTKMIPRLPPLSSSSYEVDSDEASEQHLPPGGMPATFVKPNGEQRTATISTSTGGRHKNVLESVGLKGKLKQVPNLPDTRRISTNDVFCNRELRLGAIRAIGFDMDYTLAQYQQPAFDKLAFDGAKEKLVKALGYPEAVLEFEYDHERWARGLIIDTKRGNFLKIDRHKYVRVAYHGFERISSTTRKHLYSRTFNKVPSFSEKSFVNMDTLFQLVDAQLFASLIEMKDKGEHEFLDFKTYEELYRHVRECVDLCHRDGVIKDEVARNPEKYIVLDKGLVPMLKRYRESGVKVFLLTNSYWEYTSVAMNYLFHGRKVEEELKLKNEWLDLFDLAIVGSCKPAYMVDPYLNLFRVNPQDGSLLNTDGLFEIEALGPNGAQKFLSQGKTFQGGNWNHLQAMLEVEAGEEILYVGDHLYADVLRSKRTLGWRSAFIMPELEEEMRVFDANLPLLRQITELRTIRDELSQHGEHLRLTRPQDEETENMLHQIEEDDAAIKEKLTEMAEQWHSAFHPIWGAMFNAGYQDSRFAFYVQNYACLYTARATNLGLSSTSKAFRTTAEVLPHDKLIGDTGNAFADYDPWIDV